MQRAAALSLALPLPCRRGKQTLTRRSWTCRTRRRRAWSRRSSWRRRRPSGAPRLRWRSQCLHRRGGRREADLRRRAAGGRAAGQDIMFAAGMQEGSVGVVKRFRGTFRHLMCWKAFVSMLLFRLRGAFRRAYYRSYASVCNVGSLHARYAFFAFTSHMDPFAWDERHDLHG